MKTTKSKKPELTSAAIAKLAGKLLKGPTKADARACSSAFDSDPRGLASTFGMRWWHEKVKPIIASALTQAPDKPKKKARKAVATVILAALFATASLAGEPERARGIAGFGASKMFASATDITWMHNQVDPHVQLRPDDRWGASLWGGVRFPSGFNLIFDFTRYESAPVDISWPDYIPRAFPTNTQATSAETYTIGVKFGWDFELGRK